ncbi:hypothetical protein MXD62_19465 [Frankia sp. Mgl5]|uniref:hypothetical protein n=1 Tax=Frankia sp. Mgl5 TaxID=2933793 RepID=UPI0020101B40|nr:hypothetical protein [Frankia sp. Mgl5]MCK9929331.1 hypothetical protein [Frankia sp. Mgl5]
MARRIFPDSGDRLTYQTLDESFRPVPAGMAVAVYTDPAGTIAADCLHANGDPVDVGHPLVVDAYSRLPLWQGPADGTDTLYVIVAGGVPTAVYARVDDRIDALTVDVADVVSRMDTYGVVVPWAAGDMLATIQAAITERDESGGGSVRLGPHDYQISGTLDVPNGVVLVGDSDIGGTTITCTGSNIPIVTLVSGYNGVVDMRIRYQTSQVVGNTAAIAIRLHNAFKTRIERVTILGAYKGIGLATTLGSTYLASCSFRDIEVLGWTGWAIHLNAITNTSTGSRFDNIYLHNNPSGGRDQAQGGIFFGNMSDTTMSTINVEHSKLSDPALALSSVENIVVDGLHLEGLEPNADFAGLIGLFGNTTSVVFHQVISTFSYMLDANFGNSMPFFKIDNGVRLQVYGLKQRSWTIETRALPLVYGTADLTTANVWMRDVSYTAFTTTLAGSTTNPYREYNERLPTVRMGALTGNYGLLAVGGSNQAQYTPPGGSPTDLLVASGLSSASPAALGSATAGSSVAPARGDHVHPTTGLLLTSNLSGSAALALAASASAGSSGDTSRTDHVHPTTGLLLTSALGASNAVALGTAGPGVATAVSREDHIHPTTGLLLTGALSSATPGAIATAGAAGSSSNVSRADHVHPSGGGDWTAYTPTLGNVTVGNGTSAGRYKLLDAKTMAFRTIFTFGSTSAFTGNVSVGLPGGVTAETGTLQRCSARAFDSSPTAIYYGIATVNATSVASIIVTSGGTDVNATTPITWATGDTLSVWGIVELV